MIRGFDRWHVNKHKTVRCIIKRDERYLLVVHNNFLPLNKGKWGFPGGRIEGGESFVDTLVRELREELSIAPGGFQHVGDYLYKDRLHRIYATTFDEPIEWFDRSEIIEIGWHTVADIRTFDQQNRLHTGFELKAVLDFEALMF